jgi:hypothetical protein
MVFWLHKVRKFGVCLNGFCKSVFSARLDHLNFRVTAPGKHRAPFVVSTYSERLW